MRLLKYFFIVLFSVASYNGKASDEIRNSRIEGSAIANGNSVSVNDDKFPTPYFSGWYNSFAYMQNTGKVEFGLDETKHVPYNFDFSVELTFDVTATDKFNITQTFTGKKLKIYYKQALSYVDKAQLVFDGFSKLNVVITNVDARLSDNSVISAPGELFLETEIATKRNYAFFPYNPPSSSASSLNYNVKTCSYGSGDLIALSSPSELEVYWDYVPGVEEYELEWTWVNNYPGSSLQYDFKYDATRVITKNTYYRIPLNYEGGFILYRLRHIGRGGANYSQRIEGVWTSAAESGFVSNYPSNMKYEVTAHSDDYINWSSTLTFDENGRKGSGISYMDGMLMGRQSLAKLNTSNKLIAQSVVYDYQGRPAISILPSPINAECFAYQGGLNKNTSGTNYNQANFDDDGANTCVNATDAISINGGASNYYSSSNTNKEGAQGYLPDADGLPFVQVEYMDDMTGRIKSQSMPGATHKIGDGKETKFYYANPGDGELLQLFGSEVGNVKHYDKNIVRDANGQLSASYIDMEGRVIATSLLGPKPANVDQIEDYNNSATLIDNLAKSNILDENNYSLTSDKSIFIEQAGSVQTFTYEFMPADFRDTCAPSLCFDCIYEVEIKITDECHNSVIPDPNNPALTIPSITEVVGNLSLADADLKNCDVSPVKYQITPNPLSITFQNVGTYFVTKTLKVSDINLDEYLDKYLKNNTCIPAYTTILNQQISAIDFSSCDTDCASCSTSVASYISTHSSLTTEQINALYDECEILCINQLDPCAAARRQMLEDFYPDGQYGNYDIDPVTGAYSSTDVTSIYNDVNNKFGISWKTNTLNYLDANGAPAEVNVMRNGSMVLLSPYDLTLQEFIQNFKPSWAEAFLNYHPEKCYLDFCETNKESDKYDYEMLQVSTYDEAYQKGYLTPLNGIGLPSGACGNGTQGTPKLDPFFKSTGQGNYSNNTMDGFATSGCTDFIDVAGNTLSIASYGTLKYSDFMNFVFTNGYPVAPTSGLTVTSGKSIFEMAKILARANQNPTAPFGCEACNKDQEWLMFRALYLNLKMRLVAQRRTDYVMINGCFNGCMQGSGYQPFSETSTILRSMPYELNSGCSVQNLTSNYYSFSAYPLNSIAETLPGGVMSNVYHQTSSDVPSNLTPVCSQDAQGIFNGKLAHFPQMPLDQGGLLAYYSNLISNNSGSAPSVLPSSPTSLPPNPNVTSSYCHNTCLGYAEQWIKKLKNCNPVFDENDANYGNIPETNFRNALIADLVTVCENGCDPQNPFGSSTVNPALSPAPPFASFQDVIEHYASLYPAYIPNPNGINCNYLNLDFPEPYGHDYSASGNAQNKLDTCGCNKILFTQTKFEELQGLGTLPVGVTTVEQYFSYLYSTSIVNFNDLACKCSSTASDWHSNYPWTQAQSNALLTYNLPVPEILSCTKCLPCSTIVEVIDELNIASPFWNIIKEDHVQAANLLNNLFNMNLSYDDYMNFYNGCNELTNYTASCDEVTVTNQLLDFINAYITIASLQPNTGTAVVTVSNLDYPELFRSCLFPCSDANNTPTMLTITIPYNGVLSYDNPQFHYYNGIGQCQVFDCNPKFDAIGGLFTSGATGIHVTRVNLLSTPVSFYQFQLDIGYVMSGTPQTTAAYFSYPCLQTEYIASIPTTLCNQPFSPSMPIYEDCVSSMMNQAETNAKLIYQSYVDQYSAAFIKKYKEDCIKNVSEKYQRQYNINEYHYTLYYYDQAGNLTRTVPPKGVHKLSAADVISLQSATPPTIFPVHTYVTNYKYQSYGAPVASNTPDEQIAGALVETQYVYDNIGRIQLSQNGQQAADGKYSYTLYDALGRIKEVGVLANLPVTEDLSTLKAKIAANTFESFVNAPPSPTIKGEVIRTQYDNYLNTTIAAQFGGNFTSGYGQVNLRNRVATVTYEKVDDGNTITFNYATHYTYDEHGNVTSLIQQVPELASIGKQYYKMDYEYDLISGNVNKVTFQKGSTEQFMHKYEYDADNRLHHVYTSKDNVNWDKDAKYFYYEHGPLARVEIGDQKVQGTDFAYTIHGWIKAVNSNILSENTDMGKDGAQGNSYFSNYTGLHQFIGQDAAAYSLNYYQQGANKDYKAIKTFNASGNNQNMIASTAALYGSGGSFDLATDAPDLFNGNISSMVTSIYDMDLSANNTHAENTVFPQITAYRYDQLHRITQMKAFRDISLTANIWNAPTGGNYDGSYFTQFTYDKNGNIKSQRRDGAAFMTGLGLVMDDLTYITNDASITNPTNKLIGVNDALTSTYGTDIKGTSSAVAGTPSTYDYDYDAVGNLIKDKKEFIQTIEWTVDRKVKKVIRNGTDMAAAGKNMPDLEFEYDANRQRVVKIVKPHNADGTLKTQSDWVYTYYVRDASGNIAATYNRNYVPVSGQANTYTDELKLQEHDIYGSARLGTIPSNTSLADREFTATTSAGLFQNIVYEEVVIDPLITCFIDYTDPFGNQILLPCPVNTSRTLGDKRYELTNHLGNVLTVVSDRKLQHTGPGASTQYERIFDDGLLTGITGDPPEAVSIVSNQLRVDPTAQFSGVNINYPTAPGQNYTLEFDFDRGNTDATDVITIETYDYDVITDTYANSTNYFMGAMASGHYSFNYTAGANASYLKIYFGSGTNTPANTSLHTNHYFSMDNFRATTVNGAITVVDKYTPQILETHDYYAFGQSMPGRSFNSPDYRYSHNGQEKENEISEGILSAEHWMYDSRLGRRWEMDPMAYDWQSPYATFDNNPIALNDADGLYGDPPGTIAAAPYIGKQQATLAKPIGRATNATAERMGINIPANQYSKVSPNYGARAGFLIGFMFASANGDYKGAGSCCGTEHNGPCMRFQPIERHGDHRFTISTIELNEVKRRVESGNGSLNDHKIYNLTFAPKAQAPFKTQSHHVIPVGVFTKVNNPLVASAMSDPEFAKEIDKNDWNRIPLGTDLHGNHPAYNDYVKGKLDDLYKLYGNVDAVTAARLMRELAGQLKGEIVNKINTNPGMRLNQLYGGGKSTGTNSAKPAAGSEGSYGNTRFLD